MDIKSKIPIDKRRSLFEALTTMVTEGRLFMPSQVVDEMRRGADSRRSDDALDWVLAVEARAAIDCDIEQLQLVMAEVGDVVDHDKDALPDEADPYVIALALSLRAQGNTVRVVTEDRRDRAKLSLTTAAGVLGLTVVPLLGFIRAEKIL